MYQEIKTNTGKIFVDKERKLEWLYVGDYGAENNIKADFLGYTKRIERVEHKPVDFEEKLVVTMSTQKGCPMKCMFCDCHDVGFHGNCSIDDMKHMLFTALYESGVKSGKRLNIHFARMGEPTFNYGVIDFSLMLREDVNKRHYFDTIHPVVSTMLPRNNKYLHQFLLDWCEDVKNNEYYGEAGLQFSINTLNNKDRDRMFNGMSLSLGEIARISSMLPMPVGRKYTLNFAVTRESDLNPVTMSNLFDKRKFIIKITPIHETRAAINNNFEIIKDFDVYEQFEQPLVAAGWDVIVFIPSQEEDADRITCGNALLKGM